MPLRPVSELGLVDITDVPPRAGNGTAKRQAARPVKRSEPAKGRAASTPKSGQRGGPGAATRATTRTAKRTPGSANRTRSATTVRRQTSAGARAKGTAAAHEKHRSREDLSPQQEKPRSAAKIAISVLTGASLLAGGLVLARAALHR